MGTARAGQIWKFKFGEYAVEESKMGWTVTNQKANLINTKTESNTENKFSFVLSNKTSDYVTVNAMNNVVLKELQSLELFPDIYFGPDELLMNSQFFSCFITTSSNDDET